MQTMYPSKINSPITELAVACTSGDTTISLNDASVLPTAPNIAVLGDSEDAETVLYTGISVNDITGCTRGFQGTAQGWSDGTLVSRMFTSYDYEALKSNIEDTTILNSQTAGENLSQHNLVYLKNDGKWWKASATADATCQGQLGMAIADITAEATGTIQILGKYTNGSWTWTPGSTLYVSDTSGTIGSSAGTKQRAVGFALSSTVMYFFPRPSGSAEANVQINAIVPSHQNISISVTGATYSYTTQTMTPTNYSNTITIT